MVWTAAPALMAVLSDANSVAPGRSRASDGIIGDASHSSSVSDHNPDARGVVHACDVTNDPAHGFNSWVWAQWVADRIRSGREKRVKYLVSHDGVKDVIFNPAVSMEWRQNGAAKQVHRSHLHVSILYTVTAENDVSTFFTNSVSTPINQGVFMALSDAQQAQLVEQVRLIHDELFSNNTHSLLDDIQAIGVDTNTKVTKLTPAAVARAVVAALPPAQGGSVDVAALAKAVAVELSVRLSA